MTLANFFKESYAFNKTCAFRVSIIPRNGSQVVVVETALLDLSGDPIEWKEIGAGLIEEAETKTVLLMHGLANFDAEKIDVNDLSYNTRMLNRTATIRQTEPMTPDDEQQEKMDLAFARPGTEPEVNEAVEEDIAELQDKLENYSPGEDDEPKEYDLPEPDPE